MQGCRRSVFDLPGLNPRRQHCLYIYMKGWLYPDTAFLPFFAFQRPFLPVSVIFDTPYLTPLCEMTTFCLKLDFLDISFTRSFYKERLDFGEL